LSLFKELKRRKVFTVGIAYLLIAWLFAQVLQLVFESFGTPEWMIKTALVLLAVGFPLALFLAWAYELTPDGIKRDHEANRPRPITQDTLAEMKGARNGAGNLCLMIYKSRSKGMIDADLVESILASSTRNNPDNGITGVLMATETHFLQILEGEFEKLNATFERIARDPRHEKIQLINFTELDKRKFGDWAMHGIGLFDLNQDLALKLRRRFGEDNGNIRLPSTKTGVMDLLDMMLLEGHSTSAH
jgi:hypothetical protein